MRLVQAAASRCTTVAHTWTSLILRDRPPLPLLPSALQMNRLPARSYAARLWDDDVNCFTNPA